MSQFAVHENPNPATKAAYPYLLDIQSDLLAELGTRVVAPLAPVSAMRGPAIKTLMPVLEIDDRQFVMLTPQLAGISKKQLGAIIKDLSQQRGRIITAIDLLITGI